tara:strand:+ start:294 stop:515 length:222 start_codon:yes stop_codon:yes gene_type:complete
MSNKKQNATDVPVKLRTKSFAQLEKQIAEEMEIGDSNQNLQDLVSASGQFAGYSPPHTRGGIPYPTPIKNEDT